ncbi:MULTISPECIES: metallophosphoesterase family protein [unclassified Clostridium]|uniref:metallophosphoesterase family protein n=1 Tax=unclassified Clostridium TaxID=2614128 RepID=UPI001EEA548F|nr:MULTISPECIES: metallophosphoesterase family protein [unclassified Clostridium]
MKIAVISDIHSNFDALEKVICEVNKYNCNIKICLGDMVGYYNKPNEVIEILRYNDFKCVKGNHDKFILGEINYKKENEEIYGIKRHRETLSYENLLFLKNCPEFIELKYENYYYCFCHSLKNDCQVYLKDENDIINNFDNIKKYKYYFYGHTHRKKSMIIENSVIINPGSVGQQRDEEWKPSFCILDLKENKHKIVSIEYDINNYIGNLDKDGYDKRLINILKKY